MKWNELTSTTDVQALSERSKTTPCLIFKHSTRCSISSMAKSRLEMGWDIPAAEMEVWLLDLIQFREVSNFIAAEFGVQHQSPQALLIEDGECVFDASHLAIRVDDLRRQPSGKG